MLHVVIVWMLFELSIAGLQMEAWEEKHVRDLQLPLQLGQTLLRLTLTLQQLLLETLQELFGLLVLLDQVFFDSCRWLCSARLAPLAFVRCDSVS